MEPNNNNSNSNSNQRYDNDNRSTTTPSYYRHDDRTSRSSSNDNRRDRSKRNDSDGEDDNNNNRNYRSSSYSSSSTSSSRYNNHQNKSNHYDPYKRTNNNRNNNNSQRDNQRSNNNNSDSNSNGMVKDNLDQKASTTVNSKFYGSVPDVLLSQQETDPLKLQSRQKDIDYGKNTIGYDNYINTVPKDQRKKGHPMTPSKYQSCSRRSWAAQIKIWRKALHQYDPEGHTGDDDDYNRDNDVNNNRNNETNQNGGDGVVEQTNIDEQQDGDDQGGYENLQDQLLENQNLLLSMMATTEPPSTNQ
ncbi:histone RNA hairpin-binding protein [Cavenderia fasciculata]|uniref:Histone RNA hairpin-binding protein n=1 Tax=Cavenderia fasciculata TaxID=261658 RepID=F4QCB4_CACFS|nr:histone RNA hairpin-binding protein [Cavenderia fasciculata]EGG14395.1 histone RNA hairpin-binding protein [Cavenderia fasciculata]|eukprot:XP_004353804.1 histone RNA hairpin-binding protein [Cavenderia fasciculata]